MRFAFTSGKPSLRQVSVGLGLALMLLGANSSAIAKMKVLPLDGSKVIVKETKVLEAYSTTTEYAYAKGEVFDRWVYSPWVIKNFNAVEERIDNPTGPQKRALLTADLTIPLDNLVPGKLYTLSVKSLFGCKGLTDKPADNICSLEIALNCYGYVASKWNRTFEAKKGLEAKADGEFLASAQIDPAKCPSSLHVNLRGNLTLEGKSFAIKQTELSLKEVGK